ncbi:MAG: hypothetical protein QXK37_04895 [Candidatus Woesearchaeota archaeon]
MKHVLTAIIAFLTFSADVSAFDMSYPLLYPRISSLYNVAPYIIDLIIVLVFFLGFTALVFKDTYGVSARIGIAFTMTFAVIFWEIYAGDFTLAGYLGQWIVLAIAMSAAMLYFLIYMPDMGFTGMLAASCLYFIILLSISAYNIVERHALAINIAGTVMFLYTLFRFALFLWKIFNITERDERHRSKSKDL